MIYVPYETKDKNSTHGIPEPCLASTVKTDVTCFHTSSELGHGDTARGGGVDNFAGVSFDSDITTDGIINAKKNEEVFDDTRPIPLKTDVYAFIAVAPVWSAPFVFALYVILLKYTVVGLLIYGIQFNTGDKSSKKDDTVKFFLIPVAIAMQDDLMYFYASIANVRYEISPTLQRISDQTSITKGKLIVGLLLRFIDGALNLYANFALMISTAGVLNIFLNFAALHFLQGTLQSTCIKSAIRARDPYGKSHRIVIPVLTVVVSSLLVTCIII